MMDQTLLVPSWHSRSGDHSLAYVAAIIIIGHIKSCLHRILIVPIGCLSTEIKIPKKRS